MFSNDQMNTIQTIIDLNDEAHTRTPIAYKGSLFYVYSIDQIDLCLVPINSTYIETNSDEEKIWFVPDQLVLVKSNDPDIDYIEDVIRYPQTQVAVKFAELQKDGIRSQMRIVLKNVEMLSKINVENIDFNVTNRFYMYDEGDDSYTLEH